MLGGLIEIMEYFMEEVPTNGEFKFLAVFASSDGNQRKF